MTPLIELNHAIDSLRNFNSMLEIEGLPKIKAQDLSGICREFKAIRDAYETLDEHRKRLGEIIESINRYTIPEAMEEVKTPSLKVECADGKFYRFVRSQRLTVTVTDKTKGYSWLKEIGAGGMVQETVNAGTLSAWAKKRIQDEGKDLPAEYFDIKLMSIVSVNKA